MSASSTRQFDVCIVGGGPAGSTVALRLVLLGRRVCLIERSAFPRRRAGESLTAGVWPILDSLGLRQSVMRSGALLLRRSRVRWARPAAELLTSDRRGGWLLVDRGNFDALLLGTAESEGACVLRSAQIRAASHGERGWQVEVVREGESHLIEAAYLVDATGRAGFLRANRKRLSPQTIAVWGHLRCPPGADEVLVEALPDGWCWGASVPGGKLSVMVFVDPERLRTVRRDRLQDFWRSQLARTELLAAVSECRLDGAVQARDASSYATAGAMSARLVRVGEASLALDPLSSTGVEKAMRGGEVAAIAIHTSIAHPGRAELCARFCQERQQDAVAAHTAWTTEFYGSVAHYAEMPFWRTRAAAATPAVDSKAASAAPIAAKVALPAAVRVSAAARAIEEPCIVGEEICMHPAVMHPTLNRPVAFLQGLAVRPLLDMVAAGSNLDGLLGLWSARMPRQQADRIAQWLLDHHILEAA